VLYQKADVERSASFAYFKNKHDTILKCLVHMKTYEEKFVTKFREEEKEALAMACKDPTFIEDVQKDYLAYNHNEVEEHFPPQLIIGKQVGDDKEFLVYDADPLVKVTLSEVPCEYNYSNPTGLFNLSIPHIEMSTNMYTTTSYKQYKQREYEEQKKERLLESARIKPEAAAKKEEGTTEDQEMVVDPQD
jgi:hypothetical protein